MGKCPKSGEKSPTVTWTVVCLSRQLCALAAVPKSTHPSALYGTRTMRFTLSDWINNK